MVHEEAGKTEVWRSAFCVDGSNGLQPPLWLDFFCHGHSIPLNAFFEDGALALGADLDSDGYLHAQEVINAKGMAPRAVVLHACSTLTGRLLEDGGTSMANAFFAWGAHGVVSTLGPVLAVHAQKHKLALYHALQAKVRGTRARPTLGQAMNEAAKSMHKLHLGMPNWAAFELYGLCEVSL